MKLPLLACLILAAPAALADDPTAATPLTPRAARHDVTGHCTVLETPLNPISGPCVGVPLELKNPDGTSLGVSRTTADGNFDFAVEEEGPFRLAPTSSYYVVVSPQADFEKGHRIDLRIKQKN